MPKILPLSLLLLLSLPALAAQCFIVKDSDGHTLTRQGECSTRLPPASTFKIPLSLMGYDSGFLHSETAPALPYNGTDEAFLPEWAQTTTPAHWMRYSVVWYSQRLTRALGMDKFQHYVDAFAYGNRDLTGNPGKGDGLSQAWLGSSLAISPDEQADFLGRLVTQRLAVSKAAYRHTAAILRQPDLNSWQIYGKTGNARRLAPDGKRYQVGWYVGWASKGERTLSFVYSIRDETEQSGFASQRAKAALLEKLPPLLEQAAP
ncbi:class D beta-lactamase [Craterilacuibacter sp.]|uniref:class D beta-lactamase n=1 Tax=Craterilacuibacter sp. TaxID=2870909 RepID=UPI003F367EA9